MFSLQWENNASECQAMPQTRSINSVAALAGVSIATVSRVLNDSKPVSPATRQLVLAAVEQLGYRANAFGRSLRKAESRLLLVLVPDFANPYYAEIVQGIESVTRERGYNILLAAAPASWAGNPASLEMLHNKLADGVISLAHIDGNAQVMQEMQHLSWVACSEPAPHSDAPGVPEVPYVSIDHRQAAIDAVQYLINQGHTRIGLISADETYQWAKKRHEGYVAALTRSNITIDPGLIQIARQTDYAQGVVAAAALLAQHDPPTAVFAVSDTLAIGAIKTFIKAGRRVPEDVAVIGFDNVPIAEVFEPALTTVGQPMHELGSIATEILLELMAGGRPRSRTLAHTLLLRKSA